MLLCEQRERRMEEGVKEILRIDEERWNNLQRGDKDGLIRLYESTNGREWRDLGPIYSDKGCVIEDNRVVYLRLIRCNLRGKLENETTTIFTL